MRIPLLFIALCLLGLTAPAGGSVLRRDEASPGGALVRQRRRDGTIFDFLNALADLMAETDDDTRGGNGDSDGGGTRNDAADSGDGDNDDGDRRARDRTRTPRPPRPGNPFRKMREFLIEMVLSLLDPGDGGGEGEEDDDDGNGNGSVENPGNQPGTPDTPGQPGAPDNPGQPGTPDTPGQPGTPDNPGQPGTPDTPGQPGTPDTPGQPGTPDTPAVEPDTSAISLTSRGHSGWTRILMPG